MPYVIVVRNDYPDEKALRRVLDYALRTQWRGGYAVNAYNAFNEMLLVKKVYHKCGFCQLKHFYITFSSEEYRNLTYSDILDIGFQIGVMFREYQLVYCIHEDTQNVHLHFVMNTTSFVDGHQYSGGKYHFYGIEPILKTYLPNAKCKLFPTPDYSW